MFNNLFEYRNNYLKEIESIVLYINSFSTDSKSKKNFIEYKKIIYPSIINNIYVSFEHHIKSLFIYIYKQKESSDEKSINLNNFSFKSFPGFILEKAYIENGKMILELDDEVISYTAKNMDVGTICDFFFRVGIEKNILQAKINAVNNSLYEVPFEKEQSVSGKIKFFISHRNQISHSFIEEYYEDEFLLEWVRFFEKIYCVIFNSTIGKAIETISLSKFEVIKVYNNSIVCFDNVENVNITKDSVVCYKSFGECYFYEVKSIYSNGKEIHQTVGFEKIGLLIKAVYDEKNISEKKEIFIYI